jgi:hypothetical protein
MFGVATLVSRGQLLFRGALQGESFQDEPSPRNTYGGRIKTLSF